MADSISSSPPPPPGTTVSDAISEVPATSDDGYAATIAGSEISVRVASSIRSDAFPVPDWSKYEFLSFLGRGGMGAVYKARDRKLDRIVALKFVRGDDPILVQRFLREAQAQARLDHPNLCRVFDVGQVDGRPYIAMQYVAGQLLDSMQHELNLHQKVGIIRDAAQALHEAHRQGIIHRDIKPSNIMIERLPDGSLRPVVMDFGLARESDGNRGLTETGAVVGTPSYMPPEQARGNSRLMDRRADVYSLGATLYDLLTGRPPFIGDEIVDIILTVINDDPPPVRALAPEVPMDLETIVLKCLAKEPQQRYDSARLLAEDLQRYIDGEPILGRRSSLIFRMRRRVRRNRAAYALGGVALLATLFLGVFTLYSELRSRSQALQAQRQAALAERLGQNITEMELFMRAAYSLPLHDIGREQSVVRQRMQNLLSEQARAGESAQRALSYALGRGHLVLREFSQAQTALEQAWRSGYQTSAARLALGLALGERYRQELEQAQRAGDKIWIEARTREIEAQYLKPALSYLEGADSNIEAPSYQQGLLAFYRQQYAEALSAAERAQIEAPWLAEPLKLEGDVYQVLGIKLLDRGEHREARAHLVRAVARHRAAAAIGSSDSSMHEAVATDWIRILETDHNTGAPIDEDLKSAVEACDAAIAASPRGPGLQLKAWAYWRSGYTKMWRSQEAEPDFKQSIEMARHALKLNSEDWQTYYYYSLGLTTLAALAARKGEDTSAMTNQSIAALRETLKRNQRFSWAWNDLGILYNNLISTQVEHGELDQALFQEADKSFERAIQIDPNYAAAYSNRGWLYLKKIEHQLKHGQEIDADVEQALSLGSKTAAINPNISFVYVNMAVALLLKTERLILVHGDAKQIGESLSRIKELTEQAQKIDKELINLLENTASLEHLRAYNKFLAGDDPGPTIQSGLKTVQEGEKREATNIELAIAKVRLHTLDGRANGRSIEADAPLALARTAAERAVSLQPKLAVAQDSLCEALRYSAAAMLSRGKVTAKQQALVEGFIRRGLQACASAIDINASDAAAHGNGGALLALWAQLELDPAVRRILLARAISSLERALTINKWLKQELMPVLDTTRTAAHAAE